MKAHIFIQTSWKRNCINIAMLDLYMHLAKAFVVESARSYARLASLSTILRRSLLSVTSRKSISVSVDSRSRSKWSRFSGRVYSSARWFRCLRAVATSIRYWITWPLISQGDDRGQTIVFYLQIRKASWSNFVFHIFQEWLHSIYDLLRSDMVALKKI